MQDSNEFDASDVNDQQNIDDKSKQIARFKENTTLSQSLFQNRLKSISPLGKKEKNNRNYRIILTDTGTSDGYYVELSKEITIQEYASILEEYFGLEVDIAYDEFSDSSVENGTKTFQNLDELIDFLNDLDENDE